jgi:gliding motility-associated lipoprotein GldD
MIRNKILMIAKCVFVTAILCNFISCRDINVPKPRGYFRIDLPEKKYILFHDPSESLPLIFEYPSYGTITDDLETNSNPGWFNIDFKDFKARLHLTYLRVDNNLENLMEQTYTMNVKNHVTKADAINEQVFSNRQNKVHGIIYDLKGNTATAVQFFVTDSINHYLRGSLYFSAEPNADSLAPVIEFFREDVKHLIETLRWKEI